MVYLFKNDTVVSDFSDDFCKSLENENTLAIERILFTLLDTLQKQPPKDVLQICVS